MVGRVAPNELELTELHRFPNDPVRLPSALHWDILRLYRDVLIGLRAAARAAQPADGRVSIGIDSWGVDHGLVDEARQDSGVQVLRDQSQAGRHAA